VAKLGLAQFHAHLSLYASSDQCPDLTWRRARANIRVRAAPGPYASGRARAWWARRRCSRSAARPPAGIAARPASPSCGTGSAALAARASGSGLNALIPGAPSIGAHDCVTILRLCSGPHLGVSSKLPERGGSQGTALIAGARPTADQAERAQQRRLMTEGCALPQQPRAPHCAHRLGACCSAAPGGGPGAHPRANDLQHPLVRRRARFLAAARQQPRLLAHTRHMLQGISRLDCVHGCGNRAL